MAKPTMTNNFSPKTKGKGKAKKKKNKNEVKLAMTDPTDIQTIEFLRRKTGLEPKV